MTQWSLGFGCNKQQICWTIVLNINIHCLNYNTIPHFNCTRTISCYAVNVLETKPRALCRSSRPKPTIYTRSKSCPFNPSVRRTLVAAQRTLHHVMNIKRGVAINLVEEQNAKTTSNQKRNGTETGAYRCPVSEMVVCFVVEVGSSDLHVWVGITVGC